PPPHKSTPFPYTTLFRSVNNTQKHPKLQRFFSKGSFGMFIKRFALDSCSVLNNQFTVVVQVSIDCICTMGNVDSACLFTDCQSRSFGLIMCSSFVSS